jgi:hypothetical protein
VILHLLSAARYLPVVCAGLFTGFVLLLQALARCFEDRNT